MEFFGLLHQADCFTVSFRRWHSVIMTHAVLHVLSLLNSDYRNRLSVKVFDTAHNCRVIPIITVSMKFYEFGKDTVDIILCGQTVYLTCHLNLFPCTLFFCIVSAFPHQLCRSSVYFSCRVKFGISTYFMHTKDFIQTFL